MENLNELNENEKQLKICEKPTSSWIVDDFEIQYNEGRIKILHGLDEFILNNQLQKIFGMNSSQEFNNILLKAGREGYYDENESKLELPKKVNKFVRDLLGLGPSIRNFVCTEYTTALALVTKYSKIHGDAALKELRQYGRIGKRTVQYGKLNEDNLPEGFKDVYKQGLLKIAGNKKQYQSKLKQWKGSDNPVEIHSRRFIKETRAVNKRRGFMTDYSQAKDFRNITDEELDYILEIKQYVLKGEI